MLKSPANIVRAGQPSQTAQKVAALRAVHQLLDDPIVLHDPVALPILGSKYAAELNEDPYQLNDPSSRALRAALVVRCRFAEDELARAVAAGVRQYVVLGAGLDTFAYRNSFAGEGLRVFEVDHPSTQHWKQQSLKAAGIPLPESLTFVPVDFEQKTLRQGLAEAGFRLDDMACFCWMGVTMYLTLRAIMDTLGFAAKMPRGSSIAFDYRLPLFMLNPVEKIITEILKQRAAAIGEPWLSGFDPAHLRTELLQLGFTGVEDCGPAELNARYLARRKDGLCAGGTVRLVCATV